MKSRVQVDTEDRYAALGFGHPAFTEDAAVFASKFYYVTIFSHFSVQLDVDRIAERPLGIGGRAPYHGIYRRLLRKRAFHVGQIY